LKTFVPRDREQPAAKGALLAVVIEPADGRGNGAEHVLHEIGRVGVLQAALASEAVDDWAVESDELLPGGVIGAVADLHQQAGARQR
jgi:hypothetical protein